ncbi:MAG: heme-binding protein [Planctomycetes bacterium]|nr:heme-binding protein [Planctomycetota bacterium]MCH9724843.1 heme-binding protein [Planctomycetota bacterium]MCH9778783.1 heme-binding protein [Planctomycetota bacterium]MCH9789248.1 heme-binding protein [Planctomycetota bacterium]MDF1744950.1 heme-binding protein [Gimesia sp.]
MNRKKMIYLGSAICILVLFYYGWKFTARNAYESAEYTVVESEGPFETRQYDDLMLVTTELPQGSKGGDGRFMRLFRYIEGANDQEQKVAMTTPVFMEPEANQSQRQMGFVIPKNVSEQQIPEPTNDKVQIRKRAGGLFAVIRFAGRLNQESIKTAEEKLEKWMNSKKLTRDGAAECAGYDPPWTPGPFRRNEVLVRIK